MPVNSNFHYLSNFFLGDIHYLECPLTRTFTISNFFLGDFHYLECPLTGTFTISNFFLGPFSISSNFPYNYMPYLKPHSIEFSLCQTIFSVPAALLSRHLRLYLSRGSFLKKIVRKIWDSTKMFIFMCSFMIIRTFFLYNRNTMFVKLKLNVKDLNEKCKAYFLSTLF